MFLGIGGYLNKDTENEDENAEEDNKNSGEDADTDSDTKENENSSDGNYEDSTDDEDDQSTKSWERPWDDEYAWMMVHDPDNTGYKLGPEWFSPLEEELKLILKYDYTYNELSIDGRGDRRSS